MSAPLDFGILDKINSKASSIVIVNLVISGSVISIFFLRRISSANLGTTDPLLPKTFPYLTTEKLIFWEPSILFAAVKILSEASKTSLVAQGGPFTKKEAEEFINKPFMKDAVKLRRFDDQAKILNKKTPDLYHFKHYLDKSLKN